MSKPAPRRVTLSPYDPTLDGPGAPAPVRDCAKVQVVEGTGAGLTTQTECLLRVRLRAAALVLWLGSAAFFVRNLVNRAADRAHDATLLAEERTFFWFHVAHLVVLGAAGLLLWRRCQKLSLRKLRLAELVIFGWTAAFMVRTQHYNTLYCATEFNFIPSPVGIWFVLIFTYAIFIPNTWRRAAAVIGVLAVTPIVWMLIDRASYLPIREAAQAYDHFSPLTLMMIIGFGASVYGTHAIGTLRREAFEARQLGQYRLRHLIGSGGMGEVYLAEHQLLKRPCAIKLIRPGKASDPTAVARFEREVRATATLTHWNTVEIFDYGSTEDGTFYYVMEYLPGLSLAELVERYGPLPAERVIYLLRQTCDALREAHSIGLIHRDIKPGNIFAAQRGGVFDVAKLLDFGLAKPMHSSDNLQLTQDGVITGSPLFMSPEQALGEHEPDGRGDIYSLGAVAYYLLTGRPPFEGDKPMKVLLAHAREAATPPSQLRSDVPSDLEQVVMRCLAKSPDDRFQDVNSLGQALSDCDVAGRWTREHAAHWWHETEHALATAAG